MFRVIISDNPGAFQSVVENQNQIISNPIRFPNQGDWCVSGAVIANNLSVVQSGDQKVGKRLLLTNSLTFDLVGNFTIGYC